MTDNAISKIKRVKHLKSLDLTKCVTLSALDLTNWSYLENLNVSSMRLIDCKFMESIKYCRHLKTLTMNSCRRLRKTPQILIPLCESQSLTELCIVNTFLHCRRLFDYISQIRTLRHLTFIPALHSQISSPPKGCNDAFLGPLRQSRLTTITLMSWWCLSLTDVENLVYIKTLRMVTFDAERMLKHGDHLENFQQSLPRRIPMLIKHC